MMMGSTFVLNQLKDIESDKKNKKLFIISDGILSPKTATIEVFVLTVVSILIGFLIRLEVGMLFIAFFLVTGILYNYSPAKMKDRPWGSLLANALMGWIAFAIGWITAHQLRMQFIIDSLPYLFFNTALYLFTTLPDIEGDRVSGKKTLAVTYGLEKVIYGAFILYLTGLMISIKVMDFQALFFYLLSLPLFIKTLISGNVADTIRNTKYSILFFALSICLRMPAYFLMMVIGFFGSRIYFKKRFNLNYPNFTGK